MDLNDILTALRKWWWTPLLFAVLGAYAGHSYAAKKPVTYSSMSQSYVVVNNSGTSGGDAFNAGQAAQSKMASYAALASSPMVTSGVAEALQLPMTPGEVASHLSATFAPGTVMLDITATADTDRLSSDLAAEAARQLAKQVTILETPAPGVPAWTRLVPDIDQTAPVASTPKTSKFTAAGGFGGLLAGAGLAFLLVRLDPRIRSREGLAAVFGAEPVSAEDPRLIRAHIFATEDDGRLVVASGVRTKSWPTTRQVAESIAATGASVLVVDARSALGGATAEHKLADSEGLAELLRLGDGKLTGRLLAISTPTAGSVTVLPSGTGRAALDDLLAAVSAADAIARVSDGYDHVLVDGAGPATSVAAGKSTHLYVVKPGKASAERYRLEAGAAVTSDEPRVVALVRRSALTQWAAGLISGAVGLAPENTRQRLARATKSLAGRLSALVPKGLGDRVAGAIPKGLGDRLAGTVKKRRE